MDSDGPNPADALHTMNGTVVPAFLDRGGWAGEGEITPARLERPCPLLPCLVPQPCPRYLWGMSRLSAVPGSARYCHDRRLNWMSASLPPMAVPACPGQVWVVP